MKYRIKHHSEETECQQCGCPLYVGDTATQSRYGGIYCSETCAKLGLQEEKDQVAWIDKVYKNNMAGI